MKIHGIFIGIDRFLSPSINWLNCARRDAVALYSLFSDNLDGDFQLMYDENATRSAIEERVQDLWNCSEDDIVIFSFSGHGTSTHELVTYDTDVKNIPSTTVSLDLLSEWFKKIPAKQLICIIDCCFSGGMGAKALEVNYSSRELRSGEELLKQFSGSGRVILTASKATEPAWENGKLGHGLLTYHLLEALQGAKEVRKDNKIGIFRLLEYVTSSVRNSAGELGAEQNPMLLGHITEEISFPIFKPGNLYNEAFPERNFCLAGSDIDSLLGFGYPLGILNAWKSKIPSLNQLQIDAINDFGILQGKHLVVSAPTSSGKTMVGELAAIFGIIQRKRAVFLLPLKALVNDKLKHFEETYASFDIKTIKATGESTTDDIMPLMKGQYDICLMTYEKFSAIILANPYILNQIGTIVVDEAQMIADKNRGVNLEFILTLLKLKRREGIEPQVIALSAVIGDLNGLERWLGGRLLLREERPVPLNEGIIKLNGYFRYIESDTEVENTMDFITPEFRKRSSQDIIIPLVRKLVSEGKNVIVFRETKSEAQACAVYLADNLDLPPAAEAIRLLPNRDPSVATQKLRQVLSGGISFHISDLDPEERAIVEEQFRDKNSGLKVIVATTTLAMGVNTPAEAVIVAGLKHPGGIPYSVSEYKNIIGRAGRLGFSERGYSFLIALTSIEEYSFWQNFIRAKPEDMQSNFISSDTDCRALILRVLSASRSKRGMTENEIIGFLVESFGAYQEKMKYDKWDWDQNVISDALEKLKYHQLIQIDDNGFFHTTPIGKIAGESGIEVESVIRFVDILRQTSPDQLYGPNLIGIVQLATELEQIYMPMNKKGYYREYQTWGNAVNAQRIAGNIVNSYSKHSKDQIELTLKLKKTIACLLWITDKNANAIENILMQHYFNKSAIGAIRSVVSRTCDLLPVVSSIAQILYPNLDISDSVSNLLVRLEMGVPSSIRELAEKVNRTLNRGDYLELSKNGINSVDQFMEADDEKLINILSVEKVEEARYNIKQSIQMQSEITTISDIPLYEE
ncbi:MAG: DEAD/DEAH box helicase [Flavobacteriaceae bacterium]|jgi:replicative superfamily II helicase|nr:DEAD/DEAH box helicase [Flavobacteriaceae bacterium]